MTQTWWLNPCKPVDAQAVEQAQARQQQLTKPAGSLGRLESVAVQLAGLQGQVKPSLDQLWIAIFAGDHGVVAEGVSAFPQEVTGQMLHNFVSGGAAISVLARQLGASLEVLDLGTVTPSLNLPGVRHLNIGAGTANFVEGPAMTQAQGSLALQAGRDSVQRASAAGTQLFIGGEMGIGNTTSAAALATGSSSEYSLDAATKPSPSSCPEAIRASSSEKRDSIWAMRCGEIFKGHAT